MKKLLIFASFLVLWGFAAANLKTSDVTLETDPSTGQLSPTKTLHIKLDKLVDLASYTVTCHIQDPGNANNKVVVLIRGNVSGDIFLNGIFIGHGMGQNSLPAKDTTLVAKEVTQGGSIEISSADQTDTVMVTECKAVADSYGPNPIINLCPPNQPWCY